jgi:hypothetical protein
MIGAVVTICICLLLTSALVAAASDAVSSGGKGESTGDNGKPETLPHFFIIGAAKCGTTSLHVLLAQHPDICDGGIKEKHFFDRVGWDFDSPKATMREYESLFYHNKVASKDKEDKNKECRYYVDSTPAYMRGKAVRNMNLTYSPEDFAKKKFIVLLREPAARECSWYQHYAGGCVHNLREIMDTVPPDEHSAEYPGQRIWSRQLLCAHAQRMPNGYCHKLGCLDREEPSLITKDNYLDIMDNFAEYYFKTGIFGSMYDEQLRYWLQFVRRDQLFIVNMEDLIKKTSFVMTQMIRFLGLSNPKFFAEDNVHLPKSNANEEKDRIPPCDCGTLDLFKKSFDVSNTTFRTMRIVNRLDRDKLEPSFTPYDYARKCENASQTFLSPPAGQDGHRHSFTVGLRKSKYFLNTTITDAAQLQNQVDQLLDDNVADRILGDKPEFFIIGTARAATQSLYQALYDRHSEICDCGPPQKHFFSDPFTEFTKPSLRKINARKYGQQFLPTSASANHDRVHCKYCFDTTPGYFHSSTTIENMNMTFSPAQLAKKKFILVLREPTARECSWYRHMAKHCLDHIAHQVLLIKVL